MHLIANTSWEFQAHASILTFLWYKAVKYLDKRETRKQQLRTQNFSRSCLQFAFPCGCKLCLYEKNNPTQVRRLTWVRSQQNGVFHFVKANHLYENGFIPPSWDLTSTQLRSHLVGMNFLHLNSFYQTVPPWQDCSFSLDLACFIFITWKRAIHQYGFSSVDAY